MLFAAKKSATFKVKSRLAYFPLLLSLGIIGSSVFFTPAAVASIFDILEGFELDSDHFLYDALEYTKEHASKIENTINQSKDIWDDISKSKGDIKGTLSSLDSLSARPEIIAEIEAIIDSNTGIYQDGKPVYQVVEDTFGDLGNIDLIQAKEESQDNLADSFTYNEDMAESEITRLAVKHNSESILSADGQSEGLARVETAFNSAVATETISDDSQTAISTQEVMKNLTKQMGFLAAQNAVIAATSIEERQTLALQSENLANVESHLIGEREKERSQEVSAAFNSARLMSFFTLK